MFLVCAEGKNTVIDDDDNLNFSSQKEKSGKKMIKPKSDYLFIDLAILMTV